jgi:hypothetical protein
MCRFKSSLCWVMLLVLCASCGPAAKGGAKAPKSVPSAWKKVDPGFLQREGAVYRGLEGDELYCTLASNSPAGARWLRVVAEKSAAELDLDDLLEAVQGALGTVDKMEEWELADVGWLVALRLQRETGGSFAWDPEAGEVALSLPSGQKLHPMRVIAEAFEGSFSLPSLEPKGSGRSDEVDCKAAGTRDVLRQRSLLSGRRRR